jgi:peptidyl-dipeptidase A
MVEDRARELLGTVESELRPLSIAVSLAHWEASTAGTPDAQQNAAEAESRLRVFLSSPTRYSEIMELLESNELHDPLLRRQLELLALDYRPSQLPEAVIDDLVRRSNQIQAEFYTYRARLDGREVTNNEILEILRRERDDGKRRAAWEASKQIAPRVAGPLLELVDHRNEAARSLGYSDYYSMHLELQEIDLGELQRVFDDLRQSTDQPYREAKAAIDARLAERYGMRPGDLRPWHYEDPFFQEPPLSEQLGLGKYFKGRDLVAIANAFYDGIDLPIEDVLDRSDLYERAGKDQHAYCTDIDREDDVRILCNLKEDEHWMGVLLHELGHAAYEKFIPRTLPWILRMPAHIATTEAIAMFMDRLVYSIEWLESATAVKLEDREGLRNGTSQVLRFEMLLMSRWTLVMTHFERELYANPKRDDLNALWWQLVEELQLVPRPENRNAPDWAAKIHLAVAPVYYHNYLLGEIIASQLGAALRGSHRAGGLPDGYVGCTELGTFLRERVFAHGASLHWQKLLESATGSRLSARYFLDEFVSGPDGEAIAGG